MATSRSVITPMFRASYVNIWEPRTSENGKQVWSITGILEPSEVMSDKERKKLNDMIALAKEVKEAKWPETRNGNVLAGFRNPFRKGVPEEYDLSKNPEYAGKVMVSFRSYGRPVGVAGVDGKTLLDKTQFYSGCYAIAEVTCYAYNTSGNKGVSFGLKNVRKIKDGEPLVGMNDPESAFTEVDMSDYGVDNAAMFAPEGDLIGGI